MSGTQESERKKPYQVHTFKLKHGIEHAMENDISNLVIPATNLDWSQKAQKEQCTDIISPFYKHHKITPSTSNDKYPVQQNGFKLGGTVTLLLNHITLNIIKQGQHSL